MAKKLNEENFEQEALQNDALVIAEFYTDSCIACKQLSPILADIEEEFENTACVYKINAALNEKLAEKYDIRSAPSILFFYKGKEVDRKTGLCGKDEIAEVISKFVEESR
ncbi:thioredoxin [Clostridia bacterium]|nr:thioredoxin [Clostridia bacterium]